MAVLQPDCNMVCRLPPVINRPAFLFTRWKGRQGMRKPIFDMMIIVKLSRLLDMEYKPSELAKELGVSVDTIYRSYFPAGAPFRVDSQKRYWIHGLIFRAWVLEYTSQRKLKQKMNPGQGWCFKCNQVVIIKNPKAKSINRGAVIIKGICPLCNTRMNRIQKKDDQAGVSFQEDQDPPADADTFQGGCSHDSSSLLQGATWQPGGIMMDESMAPDQAGGCLHDSSSLIPIATGQPGRDADQ